MTNNIVHVLILFYILMTAVKVLQLVLHFWASKNQKTQRIAYRPNLQASEVMLNLLANQEQGINGILDIPRKEYVAITDPLLKQYSQRYSTQKGKVFYSLSAAKKSFFQEFTGRSDWMTWFLYSNIATLATAQLAAPLGLVWCFYLVPWFIFCVASLIYEKLVKGKGVMMWVIHAAISVTISDVYVVCCKDQLSFEECIRKYKWLNFFNKEQKHPLIGKNVCPLYKRQVVFRPDVMNFELGVVEHESAPATLYEKNKTSAHLKQILILSFIVVTLYGRSELALDSLKSTSLNILLNVWPSATLFYAVRFMVDTTIGMHWDSPWSI